MKNFVCDVAALYSAQDLFEKRGVIASANPSCKSVQRPAVSILANLLQSGISRCTEIVGKNGNLTLQETPYET